MVTGVVPSPPPVLAFNFYRAKGSAIPLLVDFSSSVANSRSRAFRNVNSCTKKIPTNLYEYALGGIRTHETDLYTRLEDNLIRHRGDPGSYNVHSLTCGERDSVSWQLSMKNRRGMGLLKPIRDKRSRQEPEGRRDDSCDYGLPRSWKIEVLKKRVASTTNKNRFFVATGVLLCRSLI